MKQMFEPLLNALIAEKRREGMLTQKEFRDYAFQIAQGLLASGHYTMEDGAPKVTQSDTPCVCLDAVDLAHELIEQCRGEWKLTEREQVSDEKIKPPVINDPPPDPMGPYGFDPRGLPNPPQQTGPFPPEEERG